MAQEKQPTKTASTLESSPEQTRLDLLQRLKGSALSSSLTLLSIIQGVALADLAGVVAANYLHFAPVQWLLVATTFLLLIAGWNQITIDTLTWVQVPTMDGYVIPFIVGAFELFLNHALALSTQAWFIGAAILASLSTLGIWYVERNAAQHEENTILMTYLQPYRRAGVRYNAFGSALLLLLALMSSLGWFAAVDRLLQQPGSANLVAVLLAGGWLLGFLWQHLRYWRLITAYARSGELHKKKG